MYTHFHTKARNLIMYFFHKYFKDSEDLVTPIEPLDLGIDYMEMEKIFNGGSYKEDYKILSQKVRELGENIPPLINSYMNLASTNLRYSNQS